MKELSRLATAVQPSSTMAIDSLAKQMKADGSDVIGFGAGEPEFNTPDHIKAAAERAILILTAPWRLPHSRCSTAWSFTSLRTLRTKTILRSFGRKWKNTFPITNSSALG